MTSATNSAIQALNSGGSGKKPGTYGSAGVFQITNANNASPALTAETAGSGYAGVFTGDNALQINGGLQIPDGAGAGLVLTSDSDGNAIWAAAGQGPAGATGAQGPTWSDRRRWCARCDGEIIGATGAQGPQGVPGATGAPWAARRHRYCSDLA